MNQLEGSYSPHVLRGYYHLPVEKKFNTYSAIECFVFMFSVITTVFHIDLHRNWFYILMFSVSNIIFGSFGAYVCIQAITQTTKNSFQGTASFYYNAFNNRISMRV